MANILTSMPKATFGGDVTRTTTSRDQFFDVAGHGMFGVGKNLCQQRDGWNEHMGVHSRSSIVVTSASKQVTKMVVNLVGR